MTYEKATAKIVVLDNSDVITASGCNNKNQQGAPEGCTGNHHSIVGQQVDMMDEKWLAD